MLLTPSARGCGRRERTPRRITPCNARPRPRLFRHGHRGREARCRPCPARRKYWCHFALVCGRLVLSSDIGASIDAFAEKSIFSSSHSLYNVACLATTSAFPFSTRWHCVADSLCDDWNAATACYASITEAAWRSEN